MDKVIIVCKSVTHAQKIQSLIKQASFWCGVDRTPRKISDKKCSYSITANFCDYERIRVVLDVYKVKDVVYFKYSDKKYALLEE